MAVGLAQTEVSGHKKDDDDQTDDVDDVVHGFAFA
jgi:hypothetical protein